MDAPHKNKNKTAVYHLEMPNYDEAKHHVREVEHTPLRNSAQGTRFHEQLSLIDNTQPFLLYSGKIAAITVPNSGKNTAIIAE